MRYQNQPRLSAGILGQPRSMALFPLALIVLSVLGSCSQELGSGASQAPGSPAQNRSPLSAESQTGIFQAMGLEPLTKTPEAPDFTLAAVDGLDKGSLSSLKGKWVILNFWATWCPPCRAEMPSLEALFKTLDDQVAMVAVSSAEEPQTVKDFLASYPYTFPIYLDSDGQISSQYGISALPTTYLIDPQGRVLAGKAGSHDWNSPGVQDGLKQLLGI